jgi:vitellogenic carboxypeptidase-like protein
MRSLLVAIVCLVTFECISAFRGPFNKLFPTNKPSTIAVDDDPGEPLFLTPYIEQGKIDEARRLSAVELTPFKQQSFSGYLTVNKEYNSNMFFWFFPAQNGNKPDTPVLLWLQGGPGASSLFALFTEIGPIYIDANENIQLRPITWNKNYHLIFIDNPVGTGYSFTSNVAGYARSQDDVARDLYSALTQFFQVYTDYAANPFYVTGESYAGKYVPSITYKIHLENHSPSVKVKINLKGMSIGDGLTDPINQYQYGDFLYQIGLIDAVQKEHVDLQTSLMRYKIEQQQYIDAFHIFDELLNGDLINTTSYFYNVTGIRNYFNYLLTNEPVDQGYYVPFITRADRRQQIHVGNISYGSQSSTVEEMLLNDVMQSMAFKVEAIANANYSVLIYNGQLDVIIAVPLTMAWINELTWIGTDELRAAPRTVWKVADSDPEVAGYVKTANNNRFFLATIRNAGHMVPYDQPRAALDLLERFFAAQPK